MATSTTFETQNKLNMKTRRIFTLFSILILTFTKILAQPTWVPTTPSVGTIRELSFDINYGINMLGTVYIVVVNYNNGFAQDPNLIRSQAITPTYPGIVFTAVLPVVTPNTILQVTANVVNANTYHTIFIVAADGSGVIQTTVDRLNATTLPCTKIDILTGFTQPVVCINKGTVATFQTVILNPDPNFNGIYNGTQWTLDWGDGATAAYTSTADNDLPPLALRTHTYSTVTSCNYV